MNSYEQSILTAKAISSKQGLNIKLIEIGDISSLADYMVCLLYTSQGKIDSIVSSKGEDRREIFEEAAGISRYRYRKTDAERKLKISEM